MQRTWFSAASIVVAALIGISLLAAPALADPVEVPFSRLATEDVNAEVFMQVDASPAQIAAVESRIRRTAQVRRYSKVTKRLAYKEFARIYAHKPDMVQAISPNDLPVSFRVDLAPGAEATSVAQRFADLPGVEQATTPGKDSFTEADALVAINDCRQRDPNFEVFMQVGATEVQLAAVVTAVSAEPDLKVEAVLRPDDAYRELLRTQPSLAKQVKASDLPSSVRVAPGGLVSDETIARISSLAGVDEVGSPRDVCVEVRKFLTEGWSPEDLARAFIAFGGKVPHSST